MTVTRSREEQRSRNGRTSRRTLATILLAAAALLAALAVPASAHSRGVEKGELGVGFFYGTFDQSPNVQLVVGGAAEEFCEDNPENPFFGEPGTAPLRTFTRNDGSIVEKVNDRGQPIYLYLTELADGPAWIGEVCEAYFADGTTPEVFASGTARLKVRNRIIPGDPFVVEVFNSVRGKATGSDGTKYSVRASADLTVVDGVPQGNPEDFVSLRLREIRRR